MKWAEPPASKNRWRGHAWEKEAGEFRGSPGEWGVIATFPEREVGKARSLAYEIKVGKHIVFRPAGFFEAVSRKEMENGVKVVNVYVRYVGEEKNNA